MHVIEEKYFSEKKQRVAQSWLLEKWAEQGCECCGSREWVIQEDIVVTPVFTGGISLGGPIYPYVGVMCTNCGNTKFFNAVFTQALKHEPKGA